ncbi:tyrosine-type recombinase/integrase [Mangrovibacillus cuniculi]|uniref:Site-specific integrase n=1 Tax=Mangrovibacillus cuniculi TaxID=2593652 RepID=A0A7S8HGW6_9BACI|nr:site-specific integrase [Mangrovibacillus cuniculi]QPC48217.1 site-specific integrase [Mangrovibacillus cuniculi]
MEGIIFSSIYFKKWLELNTLKHSTVKSYIRYLKCFDDYLRLVGWQGELDFDKFYYSNVQDKYAPIDLDFMDGFIEYLQENKTKSQAMSIFSGIKSFMDLLVDYDLLEYNPLRHYKNPFYYQSIRNRAISEEECIRLLKAAYDLDPFFQQYYLIMLLQTTCGLRAKELCKLTVSQIDFEHNVIVVDKGRKTKIGTVRMTDALQKKLREYMTHPYFLEWSQERDKELFFMKDKSYADYDLNKLLDRIRIKAKISQKITNHDLRATMAYLLYKHGNNYKSIQRQLRHKKLKTTLRYLPIHVELNGYLE